MKPRTTLLLFPLVISLVVAALLVGCARDPNARKQAYVNKGNQYFERGDYPAAAIEYLNAIKIDKSYPDAHYQLAQCYLKQGIWNGAYQELTITTELQPDNLNAQIDLGILMLSAKQFKQARERANDILARDANSVDGHVLLANAAAGLDDIQQSLREMKTAIQLAPDQPAAYLNLARLQIKAEQNSAAEQNLLKALSLAPKLIAVRLALGNFYELQKNWSEAEQQYRTAIQIEPKNPASYSALAKLLTRQGKRADAEQVLAQAKQAMPHTSSGYRMLGDFYIAMDDLPKALDEYAQLFAQHPKDKRVETNYIQLLILSKRLDEAAKLNNKFLKDHQGDVDGLIMQGQILNAEGHSDQALPVLEAALKQDSQNAAAHYGLGITLLSQGDNDRGIGELQQALHLQPGMTPAYRALGAVAFRKGDMALLRQTAEGLITAQPSLPDGYLMSGMADGSAGNFKAAERDLQYAIAKAPTDSRGYTGMGQLRLREGKYHEARQLFEQALKKNPRDLDAIGGYARAALIQRQPDEAAARIEQQITRVPDQGALYLLLGQVRMSERDYPAAQQAFKKALDLNPGSVDAILALTSVQIARGSIADAIASYKRAIQQTPNDVRPYILLGSLQESQGNWQNAQESYQKALEIQPDNAAAANNLAYLLVEHGGNADLALSLAQSARRALPDVPSTADTLAWAYANKGLYGLAGGLLQEAIKASPANPTYRYHLGVVYEKNKNDAAARAQFERALQLNPPQSQADAIRKALAENAVD
jgi:tetratricopeptide (TPR) repeat protein